MIQDQLFIIEPQERNKYSVVHDGKKLTAWFMGGVFVFPNYRTEKECYILEWLGDEKRVFG